MVSSKGGIAVIGIGNILMQDEGVGVFIANTILEKYDFKPDIQIIDGGTTGLDLLPYFEENDKVIIVDAVDFGKEPGFIGSIENDDILRILNTKLSLHHLGLSDVLSTMKIMDIHPSQIFLLGIQPSTMEELEMELSDIISSKTDRMIEVVLQKLEEWGVESKEKVAS